MPTVEVDGKSVEFTDNGFLVDATQWTEAIAEHIAKGEEIDLTQEHWDIVKYLRDEHFNNGGNEPNERTILKDMSKIWDRKSSSKEMYQLFPLMPSKQGRKIAGLPQSTRKGGY